MRQFVLLTIFFFLLSSFAYAQSTATGKLFIIGGGHCPPSLMKKLVETAELAKMDYVAVLPMSSGYPDTAFYYFRELIAPVCSNAIVNMNFTAATINDPAKLDSLEHAKLIFITGGDQARFMQLVMHTPVQSAILKAFAKGAVIAGTSAGAAVMSDKMITGNQLLGDTTYRSTFPKLIKGNIEFSTGLGLLRTAIIDQHFVVRSRYNRLLSALQAFPTFTCIGIDESTAIIVRGNKITVTGEGQVLVLADPVGLTSTDNGLLKLKDARLSIYTAGDIFNIK